MHVCLKKKNAVSVVIGLCLVKNQEIATAYMPLPRKDRQFQQYPPYRLKQGYMQKMSF
jgi:hypothetical protein